MPREKLTLLLILCPILAAGCGNGKTLPANGKAIRVHKHTIARANENRLLKDTQFTGSFKKGNIEVFYQAGLQAQANHIAKLTDRAFSHIENSTGFHTSYDSFTVYLILTDEILWDVCKIVTTSDNGTGVILIVQSVDDSCESIISHNSDFHSAFFHEIIEGSLLFRKEGTAIQHDYIRKEFGFINRKVLNYTRWFREGFSTYCAYLAHEAITSDSRFDTNQVSHAMLLNGFCLHPFSALTKIGKDLFTWHQFSSFPQENLRSPNLPNPQKTVSDYYDGSFGLFMLIRDKFGADSIHRIIQGIDTLKYADGPALIELTNTILDTDIEQLVENFHFPQTGLYMEPLSFYSLGKPELKELSVSEGLYVTVVEPGSPAEKAGIRKGDVIYRINDKDIKANLDFEFAIYRLMDQQSVTVNILRDKDVEVITELRLAN
jgi:hypothetical protein